MWLLQRRIQKLLTRFPHTAWQTEAARQLVGSTGWQTEAARQLVGRTGWQTEAARQLVGRTGWQTEAARQLVGSTGWQTEAARQLVGSTGWRAMYETSRARAARRLRVGRRHARHMPSHAVTRVV